MKKYIVITGASSGIGAAAAKAFARRGENLILIARRAELLQSLKDEIAKISPESDVVVKICDLARSENILALWDELKSYELKALINSAGFGDFGLVGEQDLQKNGKNDRPKRNRARDTFELIYARLQTQTNSAYKHLLRGRLFSGARRRAVLRYKIFRKRFHRGFEPRAGAG